jgi:ABC-type lipoprotein release transport system permease subunit
MKRYLNLLDFTLYSLLRRKWKILFLMLLFSYLVFLFSSVLLLTGAIKNEAKKGVRALPDITIQRLSAGRQVPIPIAYGEKLKEVFGIERIEPRIWGYYFVASTQANYTIIGNDHERDTWKNLGQIVAQGKDDLKLGEGEAILGEGILKDRYLRLGQTMTLDTPSQATRSFQLVGAFKGVTNLHTYDVLLLTQKDAREILGVDEGFVTDFGVTLSNKNEITTVAKKIVQILPGTRVVIKGQLARTYDMVYSWRSGFTLITLLGCLFAFAMMVWERASGLSAEEKREIGILKATGWDTSDILIMKSWEGLGISVASFMAGLIVSYVFTFVLGAPLLKSLIVGWSVLYPPFTFTPGVSPDQILVLFSLTVVPYLIATVIPSWRAATIDPDTVIRGV